MTALTLADDRLIFPPAPAPAEETLCVTRHTSRIWLLAIYSIIPICILCAVTDQIFFGGWLKAHLPRSPDKLFLFLIILVQPHIMASAMMFCDRDYLKRYGKQLLPAVLILFALVIFFPRLIHAQGFMIFYALWTMVHTTGQQLGVARTMGRGFDRSHTIWRWMALLLAVPIYFQMFSIVPLSEAALHHLNIAALTALALFIGISCVVYRSTEDMMARYYVAANITGAVAEVTFFFTGYYFFVTLISRIVHDISAFTFYISHDINRNAGDAKNIVYRSLGFLKIPISALCPLLAVILAFPITYYTYYGNNDIAYRLWLPFTFFHYYTDSFVWKKGSLHREYITMR